jgi:predicted methyltransferase
MLGVAVNDYIDADSSFKIEFGSDDFLVNHVPSWRMDLIADESVDLIVTVQVLGELRPDMTEYVIDNFHRLLKPGGILYVRDHGKLHNPNGTDIKAAIAKRGFRFEFEPALADKTEVHGVPKVWRK